MINLTSKDILKTIKELKPKYQKEGVEILGLFGSFAKNTHDDFSDIDIAYKLDYERLANLNDNDPFLVLKRINEIQDELKKIFKRKVDFVPNKNEALLKEMIYV